MKVLITGGCGFLGSNIASRILQENSSELFLLDNLERAGAYENLQWLKKQGTVGFMKTDIRDTREVEKIISDLRPAHVFHLAGQVAMTTSISDPIKDFSTNVVGTLNLLESIRKYSPETAMIYSSTNKVYGDLEWAMFGEQGTRYFSPSHPNGFGENIPLEFHSPYGCSKGSADQYTLDYSRIFGLKTTVFRHSSMYGGRQFATYDQGWIGWFCKQAYLQKHNANRIEPFTISGNGKQVRDILHADDMVDLYLRAPQCINKINGHAFNIGGGMANSLSLIELLNFLEESLDVKLAYSEIPVRESDQKVFVADLKKVSGMMEWSPKVTAKVGLGRMLDWIRESSEGL